MRGNRHRGGVGTCHRSGWLPVAGDNPSLHQMAARKGWTVMLTPRHATVPQLMDMRERLAGMYASQGLDKSRVAIAPLRHV